VSLSGPWAEHILLPAWRSKCQFGSLRTLFFSLDHNDEKLRPCLVHLAMFFNRPRVLRCLVEFNCSLSGGSCRGGAVVLSLSV
jgi:hypothetical protein